MTQPQPTPGPALRTPDPGVTPKATPAPSPGPAPGTDTGVPKTGTSPTDTGSSLLDQIKQAVTPSWLSGLDDGITAVRTWISDRHNWVRVGWFAAGGAMLTIGFVMVAERPVMKAADSVVKPVGNIVKEVKPI